MDKLKQLLKKNDEVNIHILAAVVGTLVGVITAHIVNRAAAPEYIEGLELEDDNGETTVGSE